MNFDPKTIKPAILRTIAEVRANFKFDIDAIIPALRSSVEDVLDYKTRTSRKEYWHFSIAYLILLLLLSILALIPFLGPALYFIGTLILCLIGLNASIRRLHDSNVSGIYLLAAFVPIIGALFVLYLLVQPSDEENNTYGQAIKFIY